jgi:GNAT superfamily N-acetyltransferase
VCTLLPARQADVPAVTALLAEKDLFYGTEPTGSTAAREHQVSAALFGDPPAAQALLAWHGDELAGIAAYTFLWPAAGVTRSLYLKELYVAGRHRRAGVGGWLMNGLSDIARRHDCSRMEWTTDETNEDAQRFYAELGARVVNSKLFYRMALG